MHPADKPVDSYREGIARVPLRIGRVAVAPPVLQAPMAGFTNQAYRSLIRRLGGVGLTATEMVSARSFVERDTRETGPPQRLWGVRDESRPLAVQIWDNDPETLAAVAVRLVDEYRVSVVDLNFGCPARDVATKAQSGSYLLRDPQRVGEIVERVVRACGATPVTAKIRLGWTQDTINAGDVAQAVEDAGGAAVTVHGRTAEQLYRGHADWEAIAAVRTRLRRIPLIGNGDIKTPDDAYEAFARYGVDGVMIGRAGLGRPWLFRQIACRLRGEPVLPSPEPAGRRDILLSHYAALIDHFGARKATILMRKYACCYVQGLRGARAFRGAISQVAAEDAFRAALNDFFVLRKGDA